MKVLIVTTNVVRWGGSEVLWANVAEVLLKEGHEVMVSIFNHKPLAKRVLELKKLGAKIHKRPFPSFTDSLPFYSRAFAELKLRSGLDKTSLDWQSVIKFKPESVLISSGETFDYIMSFESYLIQYCLQKSIPYILLSQFNWEHSMDISDEFRASRKKLVDHANGSFFVSHRNYEMAEIQLAQRIDNSFIVNNPSKVSGYIPYPKSKKIKMAVVARYESAIKGQANLLYALSTKFWKDIDFELNFYGSGKDEDYLKELCVYLGLNDKVNVNASVDNIEEVWQQNQILILPSRAEGSSLALLEAMKSGRTAVVTDVGDSALWISKKRGYVADSNTKNSMNSALVQAVTDNASWEEKGRLCSELMIEFHKNDHDKSIANFLVSQDKGNLYVPSEYLNKLNN